jgi:hypothetical protein
MIIMAEYRTFRLCHQLNNVKSGDIGNLGTFLGRMSGEGGVAPHLHADVAKGKNQWQNRKKFEDGVSIPDRELLYRFVNENLFKIKPHITVGFNPDWYRKEQGVGHYGLDCVPIDRKETIKHWDIYWPLPCQFKVVADGRYNDNTTYLFLEMDKEELMRLDEERKIEKSSVGNILEFEYDWQWKALEQSLYKLYKQSILSDDIWYKKAREKVLTKSEAAMLGIIISERRK